PSTRTYTLSLHDALPICRARRLTEAAGDDLVVEHDGQPREPPRQRQQPLALGTPEDVEGQQHVVGDAGLGEHLDLAELLAGDAQDRKSTRLNSSHDQISY